MPDTRIYPSVKEIIQAKIDAKAALEAKEAKLLADKQQSATLPVIGNGIAETTGKQETNMPETTETRASAMMDRLKNAQSSAQVIEAMKQAEQAKADESKPVSKADGTKSAGNGSTGSKLVEPRQFTMVHSHMGQTDSFVVNMNLVDLIGYAGFERSLYSTEDGKPLSEKQLKEKSFLERFQRQLDSDRVRDIARYLVDSPLHYFPPLICVPSRVELHDSLVEKAKASANGSHQVELSASSILAIDGQHRLAGIKRALEEMLNVQRIALNAEMNRLQSTPIFKADGETEEDRNRDIRLVERQIVEHDNKEASLRAESMPVVIVAISPDDLETRQQLFSDINKTPRKVSKAIATLYDHVDKATVLAKYCAGLTTSQFGDGHTGLETLVNLEGITPKKTESKPVTLTNLASMIQPEKGMTSLVNAFSERKLELEEVGQLVSTVIYNLPRIRELIAGSKYSEVAGRYVCYNSVFYKGMGRMIDALVAEVDRKKKDEQDYSGIVATVERLMVSMSQSEGWSVDDELWTDSTVDGKPAPVVNSAGKVENKITTVRWMGTLLLREAKRLRGDSVGGEDDMMADD